MSLSPAFVFSMLLATLYGALMHFIFGGNGRRLFSLILAAWIGFAIGQAVGRVLDIRPLAIGVVNILGGSVGALISIVIALILSRPEPSVEQ